MEQKDFVIKLAGVDIAIKPIHNYIRRYCQDYLTDAAPEVTVEISQAQIEYEREKSREEDLREGIAVRQLSDAYLETLAVYRKIAEGLLARKVLLAHGSCIAVDGEAYLFTAKSGTGKSTHTRLWRQQFGDRAFMVNDDKPLLRITEQGVVAYGTPWNGKHRLSTNTAVPLKAICILERGEENRIEAMEPGAAYPFLLQQIYRPGDSLGMLKVLDLVEEMLTKLPVYRLRCNMDPAAALVSYAGMNQERKST